MSHKIRIKTTSRKRLWFSSCSAIKKFSPHVIWSASSLFCCLWNFSRRRRRTRTCCVHVHVYTYWYDHKTREREWEKREHTWALVTVPSVQTRWQNIGVLAVFSSVHQGQTTQQRLPPLQTHDKAQNYLFTLPSVHIKWHSEEPQASVKSISVGCPRNAHHTSQLASKQCSANSLLKWCPEWKAMPAKGHVPSSSFCSAASHGRLSSFTSSCHDNRWKCRSMNNVPTLNDILVLLCITEARNKASHHTHKKFFVAEEGSGHLVITFDFCQVCRVCQMSQQNCGLLCLSHSAGSKRLRISSLGPLVLLAVSSAPR